MLITASHEYVGISYCISCIEQYIHILRAECVYRCFQLIIVRTTIARVPWKVNTFRWTKQEVAAETPVNKQTKLYIYMSHICVSGYVYRKDTVLYRCMIWAKAFLTWRDCRFMNLYPPEKPTAGTSKSFNWKGTSFELGFGVKHVM